MTRLKVGDRAEGLVGIYTGMRGTVTEDKGETQGYMVRFDLPLGHATQADPEPYWLLDDEVSTPKIPGVCPYTNEECIDEGGYCVDGDCLKVK